MLQLIPMTDAEFESYLETAVRNYAQAHIEAGDCEPGEALGLAKADYDSLLPEGLRSPDQHLFSIHDEELAAVVGMVWYNLREKRGKKSAFIYDFVIAEAYRRKGLATKTKPSRSWRRLTGMGMTKWIG